MDLSNRTVLDDHYPLVCQGIPTAIYLLPEHNEAVASYMKDNYEKLFNFLINCIQVPFYYLPEMMKTDSSIKRFNYNHPYADHNEEDLNKAITLFTELICEKNNLDLGEGGIALFDYHNPTEVFDFYPLNPNEDFFYQLSMYKEHLQKKMRMVCTPSYVESIPDANPFPSTGKLQAINEGGKTIEVEIKYYSKISFSKQIVQRYSDEQFDEEALKITQEIEERIEMLRERGYTNLLFSFMTKLQNKSLSYSKLFITKDYRIFLSDWDMREVKMTPLPKAIFIFFLRHPEGVLFKELIDYRDEIRKIYMEITLRENIDDAEESINALVDPMNNSINEKCSRIRMAFLEVVSPEIARQYHVTGKKGEPKLVALDRELVVWE